MYKRWDFTLMNDARMTINIYKLDAGYNDKRMNSNELIKDYKQNIHKWYFIAAADIVFSLIIAFVNFKVPDTVMMSLIIYIVVLALLIVSIACLVIIFAYGIIMKESPLQLIIIFLTVIYAMFSTRE